MPSEQVAIFMIYFDDYLIPIDYMINRNTFSIYFRYTEQIVFGTVIIKSLVEMSFQITLLEKCRPIDM